MLCACSRSLFALLEISRCLYFFVYLILYYYLLLFLHQSSFIHKLFKCVYKLSTILAQNKEFTRGFFLPTVKIQWESLCMDSCNSTGQSVDYIYCAVDTRIASQLRQALKIFETVSKILSLHPEHQ